jgi:DnaK suppressor protein
MNATATKSSAKGSSAKTKKSAESSSAEPLQAEASAGAKAKPIAKQAKSTVKSSLAENGEADVTSAATKTAAAPKPAATTKAAARKSPAPAAGSNAAAVLADTMEKPVVSKVSEVATKTTKPTSAGTNGGNLLTEEQILKMTEEDYMNEAQLAFFKARLQQLERDLLKNAGETTEHLRETVLVPDPADRATIEEEHALELRTRDRERKLLKKVQQAIASIDAGDYGWCEETGEPIGIPRLLARPTATLSLEAQQRRELKQKLYGD